MQEDYLEDYVATCKWPADMAGNWVQAPQLQGRLRLCTRSLFFEPDDVRVPIARYGPTPACPKPAVLQPS